VSALVVACPCAFGVAASLALSLAVLRLARAGVLVKDPSVLERLRDVNTVVFDKTGTLTRGEISILHIGWLGPEDASLLASIRAVEAESRHPIGFALARLLPQSPGVVAEGIVEVPGLGVTGMVAGRRVAAGRPELFAQPPAAIPCGPSRVWFGYAGESPAGYMDLSDALRPEAAEVVTALARRGMTAELFSGDAPEPTQAKAAEAGIPSALGGLRPEQKAERVRALRQAGRNVAFIGDGFNDAEAMAAADVGVAMASGADLAMLSAPVVITRGDLRGVVELLDTARRAVRVLRGNFLWAFVYNLALLPVAAFGLLAPIHAAGLMVLSSASVALNSLRPMVNARCSSTINH